jgi:hypothetical protein
LKNYDSVANPEDIPTKSYVDNVVFVGNTQPTGSEFWVDTGTADPTGPAGGNALDQATTDARYVQLGGSTMTGPLIQSADPATALATSTKQYTDTKVAKAGDTMTGPLVLAADPAAAMQPATRQYVDAKPGRNVFRNGDMGIAQRGNGAFTGSQITADGWWQYFSGGTSSTTRTVQALGLGSPLLVTTLAGQAAAGDFMMIDHHIEGVGTLSGATVTLSFSAKAASGTPKIGIELDQYFGAGGSPSTRTYTAVGTVTLSTTLTRYTVTTTIPSVVGKTLGTDGSDFLGIDFFYSAGSTYASRASSIGIQNNTFSITDIQLETGPTVTSFEKLSQQAQLAWCQRYFWRMSSQGANWFRFGVGVVRAGTIADVSIQYPVTMRVTPTVAFSAASTFGAWDGTASGACTAITVGDSLNNIAANIFGTWSGLTTQGRGSMLASNATATAYIDFSAEL